MDKDIPHWKQYGLSVFGTDDSDFNVGMRQWARCGMRQHCGAPNTDVSELAIIIGQRFVYETDNLRTDWILNSVWREAYMLQWAKVDIEKVWDDFEHDHQRLQVMHVIELMNRKAVPHEGLDAVFANWQRRNK